MPFGTNTWDVYSHSPGDADKLDKEPKNMPHPGLAHQACQGSAGLSWSEASLQDASISLALVRCAMAAWETWDTVIFFYYSSGTLMAAREATKPELARKPAQRRVAFCPSSNAP